MPLVWSSILSGFCEFQFAVYVRELELARDLFLIFYNFTSIYFTRCLRHVYTT